MKSESYILKLQDALSIACTTFGVCTSLGFGVESINYGFHRLNSDISPNDEGTQVGFTFLAIT